MANYRVLDIETVPDHSLWTQNAPKYSLVPGSRGPYDADLERLERLTGEPSTRPAHVVPMDDFPPPQAHRVVSLAWVDLITDDPKSRYYHYGEHRVLGGWDCPEIEREILRAFGDAQRSDRATIVSWNGRTFDLPVINLRSLHHKLRMDWYYQTDGVRYRYSEEGHCDLMDVFSDYGAARAMKLGDVARTMGLPGKHGEVAGHNVALTVASGNNEALVKSVNDYCLSDTIQTALLYVRSRFHKGITNAREYNSAVLSFSDCCSKALPALDLKTLLIAEEP